MDPPPLSCSLLVVWYGVDSSEMFTSLVEVDKRSPRSRHKCSSATLAEVHECLWTSHSRKVSERGGDGMWAGMGKNG